MGEAEMGWGGVRERGREVESRGREIERERQ